MQKFSIHHKHQRNYDYGNAFDTLEEALKCSPWIDDSKYESSDFFVNETDEEGNFVAAHEF
jgi:hypothetical protein